MSDGQVREDWWTRVSETLERVGHAADARPAILEALPATTRLSARKSRVCFAPMSRKVAASTSRRRAFDSRCRRHRADVARRRAAWPYLVVRAIGRGGMGSVFEAYRADDDFRKRVAIKTITYERAPALLMAFGASAAFSRSSTPEIAALLDGGVLPSGAPDLRDGVRRGPTDRRILQRIVARPT